MQPSMKPNIRAWKHYVPEVLTFVSFLQIARDDKPTGLPSNSRIRTDLELRESCFSEVVYNN